MEEGADAGVVDVGRRHARARWALAGLTAVALALRLMARLIGGETAFLRDGYQLFLWIATSFVQGTGLCEAPGALCAGRVPGYPLFLSPFVATGHLYPGAVLAQAALGAAGVWLAWSVAVALFDRPTALIAAALTAVNPYAVVHDTALQDTVLVNGLVLLAVLLLHRLRGRQTTVLALSTGLVLALVVLTSARLAVAVAGCLLWTLAAAGPNWKARGRNVIVVLLPIGLLVGAWTMRNWHVVGAPVLTTLGGQQLWIANNEWTFVHLPAQSIDLVRADSFANLSPDRIAELKSSRGEVGRDRVLARWAREYISAHPGQTLWRAIRKVWSAASAEYSPARGRAMSLGYALLFVPVHVLALVGLWRSRGGWRAHALIYVLVLTFVLTTAVFWSHTSHKSYLDPFLFIYAASIVTPLGPLKRVLARV